METVNFYSREGIWMSGYIDMHCHILPEVDDGARRMDRLLPVWIQLLIGSIV